MLRTVENGPLAGITFDDDRLGSAGLLVEAEVLGDGVLPSSEEDDGSGSCIGRGLVDAARLLFAAGIARAGGGGEVRSLLSGGG
jgi:hypothetical protein